MKRKLSGVIDFDDEGSNRTVFAENHLGKMKRDSKKVLKARKWSGSPFTMMTESDRVKLKETLSLGVGEDRAKAS